MVDSMDCMSVASMVHYWAETMVETMVDPMVDSMVGRENYSVEMMVHVMELTTVARRVLMMVLLMVALWGMNMVAMRAETSGKVLVVLRESQMAEMRVGLLVQKKVGNSGYWVVRLVALLELWLDDILVEMMGEMTVVYMVAALDGTMADWMAD